MTTIYHRTFHLQSSHFNSRKSYETVWEIVDCFDKRKDLHVPTDEILAAFKDIHGHNFKVQVNVVGEKLDNEGFLVDDVQLARIVMAYDNCNLSMLPGFLLHKRRASTELLADFILNDLRDVFGGAIAMVRVYENDDIYAQAV